MRENVLICITSISKTLNNGMVIDFKILKEIIKREIEDRFDHTTINKVLKEQTTIEQTTIENIVKEINTQFGYALLEVNIDLRVTFVKLYETEKSYAIIRNENL